MKRSDAVKEAAHHLQTAELALDGAFGETAALATNLVRIRIQAGLSATVGQPALDAVSAAIAALASARSELVRAHGELDGVKSRMGCRTVATGGGDKDDEIFIPESKASSPLRIVAA